MVFMIGKKTEAKPDGGGDLVVGEYTQPYTGLLFNFKGFF